MLSPSENFQSYVQKQDVGHFHTNLCKMSLKIIGLTDDRLDEDQIISLVEDIIEQCQGAKIARKGWIRHQLS